MPLDYELEARHYDETRGGLPRAQAAADAVRRLLPPPPATVIDLGGGTGLVASLLDQQGFTVGVVDQASAMLAAACDRLPGAAVRASGTQLPLAPGSVDAVACVWLLHLLTAVHVNEVVTEVSRIIRPGGIFVTTVDKASAHGDTSRPPTDSREHIMTLARTRDLELCGETTFIGHGQDGLPTYSLIALRRGGLG